VGVTGDTSDNDGATAFAGLDGETNPIDGIGLLNAACLIAELGVIPHHESE
jgi:hypothetical protein